MLVNGHPGSGKTTLAGWLAAELGVPCLSKDLFKETLYERLPPTDREGSRQLGRAAYDLAFAAVEAVLSSGGSAILEAPLHREFSQARLDDLATRTGVVASQLLLFATPEVLEARYVARQASEARHPGHDVGFSIEELRTTVARPIDAPEVSASLEIDTTDFVSVDRAAILEWVRARLEPVPGNRRS